MRKKKRKRPVLRGRSKADCSFQCPAKGRTDFGVWPRKGETAVDACWRGLRDVVKLDETQIPHCKALRVRYVD